MLESPHRSDAEFARLLVESADYLRARGIKAVNSRALELLTCLGYREDELHFDYGIWRGRNRTSVFCGIASSRIARPHLIVLTGVEHPVISMITRSLPSRTVTLRQQSRATACVEITGTRISIDSESLSGSYDLNTVDAELAGRLFTALVAPARLPTPESIAEIVAEGEPLVGSSGVFTLERWKVRTHLLSALTAESAQDRGEAYEHVAAELLAALAGIEVRHRRLRTATAEFDLVCRFTRCERWTFFEQVSNYFAVEVRNWARPVGAKDVRDFTSKLRDIRANFGVMFSRSGVTGREGTDALGELTKARHDGIIILVLTEEHIEQVLLGRDLYLLLEEGYEERRLGLSAAMR